MKLTRMLFLGGAILCVAGCSAVYVSEPIGANVVALEESEWNGTWVAPDGETAIIAVRDAEAGVLWIAGLDERDGELAVESMVAHVRDASRSGRERLFISVEEDDRYYWGLVIRDEDTAVFYSPDVGRFRELVRAGTLPGTLGEESDYAAADVFLGKLDEQHLEIIFGSENGNLFVWDEPYVIRRVAR